MSVPFLTSTFPLNVKKKSGGKGKMPIFIQVRGGLLVRKDPGEQIMRNNNALL